MEPDFDTDLGGRYLAQRSEAARLESDPDALFAKLSGGGQTGPSDAAPKPATPPSGQTEEKADPAADPLAAWANAATGAFIQGALYGQGAVDRSRRVGGDVGRGLVETPLAVARGAAGAVQNVFSAADAAAEWLNDNVADLKVPVPDWVPKWVQNPARGISAAAASARGSIPERESMTGKAVEFTSQWLTAAAMTRRMGAAFGMKPSTITRLVNDMAAGAIGFDPNDPRLSNLIDDLKSNPLTDWLKAQDDDPELLGRLKAGLEAGGLGKMAEGVVRGLKLLKAKSGPMPEPPKKGADTAADAEPAVSNVVKLQPANENPIRLSDDLVEKSAAFLRGEIPDAPVQVNLERFDGQGSIIKAIGDISRMLPEQEVIGMEKTLQAARDMGMTAQELQAGIQGGVFDRRQISAGWMLYRSAAGEVVKLADKARQTGAPEDIARFNAGFQTAYGILQTVKGQSSEIARALQIHNAIRKSEPDMVKGLQKLIDEAGGSQIALDMAEKVAALNDPAKAARFLADVGGATTRDKIVYAWSNILLSNPASLVANVADTTASTLMQVPETWFASKFGGDVAKGEAAARLYGIVNGMRDGVRLAGQTWKSGESAYTAPGSRVEGQFATSQDLSRGGMLRQAGDYLQMMIPTRLMQASDELTKTMNYRGEMHALAYRESVKQGLEGAEQKAFVENLIAEAPPWLTKAAEAQAIKGTFNEPLHGIAANLAQAIDGANVAGVPVGRIVVPFIRTPINLLRWTVHRTPAAFLSPSVQADIAAGGAARDMALGRVAAGSAVAASFADLAMNGVITGAGPKDPELRAALMRTGWQPYSFRMPDGSYVSYGRSGTLGSLIGIAADATELSAGVYGKEAKKIDLDGIPVEDSIAAATAMPFAQAILNKQFMSGAAGIIEALADPQRKGDSLVQKLAGSVVPAGVAGIERTVDPEIRRAQSALDAIKARIPGVSEELPPRLNLWGDPIKDETGIYNLFLPARVSEAKGDPIDREIVRLQMEPQPPQQVQAFGQKGISLNIKLSPEVHNRLIELAGNGLKDPRTGKGAKDTLNDLVASTEYQLASDEKRELMIGMILQKFRAAAKQKLIEETPELQTLINDELTERATAIKTPRGAPAGLSIQ